MQFHERSDKGFGTDGLHGILIFIVVKKPREGMHEEHQRVKRNGNHRERDKEQQPRIYRTVNDGKRRFDVHHRIKIGPHCEKRKSPPE